MVTFSKISHNLSLVILLIDGFENKIITTSEVTVKILNNPIVRPVKKDNGYFIFQNLKEKNVELLVSGYKYISERRFINLDDLDKTNPVLRIVLNPSFKYPIPSNTTIVKGLAVDATGSKIPEATIKLIFVQDTRLKLLKEISNSMDNKKVITLYNPTNRMLDGKEFLLKSILSKNEELLEIEEAIHYMTTYQLKNSILDEYPAGSPIIPIVSSKTDKDGALFIPISNANISREVELTILKIQSESINNSISIKIKRGQTNSFNLLNF